MKKLLLTVIWLMLSVSIFGQDKKFEGYNIILDVPEDHRSATCALRYAQVNTTEITISDLNPQTPLNVRSCNGSGTTVALGGSTATMRANIGNNKWCFTGEDDKYRISFRGDQYSGTMIYDWIAMPENPGFYDVKQFGAVGDGRTDDTLAIRSALAFVAARNGGTLYFPEGDYLVGSEPGFKGLVLPAGVTIQGTNSLQSNNFSNNYLQKNSSRITLAGRSRALFKIGECVERAALVNIELYAQSSDNTYGVEALGAYTSSQDFYFDRVVFNNFYRGIYAHGLPQTDLNWQFDYIKINHSRFIFNRDAGIYTNIRNSDWKIEGSLFINPRRQAGQNADSMHFERVAAVLVSDTYGGGFQTALGGTFLDILDSGNITVLTSQTESMTNSIVYNGTENPYAGDYSYPITILNSVLHDPIVFKARRNFVSIGSSYGGDTFQADERLRVYSTGDRFCYDGYTLGCRGATKKNFDRATVVFMTGQPSDGQVAGHPTVFGTDVQFNSTVQMPSFTQNLLPTGKPNGSMVYCVNCRRNATPCQAGGAGAPAMVVNGQWSCL